MNTKELIYKMLARGYKMGSNPIAGNPYTSRFGNNADDKYAVELCENDIRLIRYTDGSGCAMISYCGLNVAERKRFAYMCLSAELVECK